MLGRELASHGGGGEEATTLPYPYHAPRGHATPVYIT